LLAGMIAQAGKSVKCSMRGVQDMLYSF